MVEVDTLRVMSYNIEGHAVLKRQRHLEEISAVIRQLRPDVVGLQEVHRNTHSKRSGDQIAQLAEATSMQLHFGRSIEGFGGEYGNAVLTRGRIVSGVVHALPGKGEARSLLETEIEVRGFRFTFFVTHLAAWFWLSRETRRKQLDQLTTIIGEREQPVLLCGDFNASPRTPEMMSMMKRDHLRVCGEHVERSHRFSRQRLDYLFANGRWKTRDSWVMRLGPSDHWPLIVDLELEPSVTAEPS